MTVALSTQPCALPETTKDADRRLQAATEDEEEEAEREPLTSVEEDSEVAPPALPLRRGRFAWASRPGSPPRSVPLGQQLRLASRDVQVWALRRGEGDERAQVCLALSRCTPAADPCSWLLEGAAARPGGTDSAGCAAAANVTWAQRTVNGCRAEAANLLDLLLGCADHFRLELLNRGAHEALVRTKFAPRLPGEELPDPHWGREGVRLDAFEREAGMFLLSLQGRAHTSCSSKQASVRASGSLEFRIASGAGGATGLPARGPPPPPEQGWFGRSQPAHGPNPGMALPVPPPGPLPEALHPVLGACYVVHMASQPDRVPNVSRLCALATEAGVPCRIVDAVDGRAMAPPQTPVELFWDYSRRPVQVRDHLRPGEVGCLLSHCQAWARIAADPAPGGHVFEDDAVLAPHAFEVMARAADALADSSPPAVIYADRGWPRALSWEDLEYEPLLPHAPARRILCTKYCTAAYWISRGAARLLLRFVQMRSGGGWLPSDDLMSVAAGVHLGLRTPEMEHLAPLRKGPLVHLYHTEPRTLVTLTVDYGETEPTRQPEAAAPRAELGKATSPEPAAA